VLLEQQVLGRVARRRELREQDDLRARVAGAGDVLADPGRVALEVADARVDLGEGETDGFDAAGHGRGFNQRAPSSP
jgi:hypothetical protein